MILGLVFPRLAFSILTLTLASPPLIHGKSRMRKRACTDLCGGRPATVVPTATITGIWRTEACQVLVNRIIGNLEYWEGLSDKVSNQELTTVSTSEEYQS